MRRPWVLLACVSLGLGACSGGAGAADGEAVATTAGEASTTTSTTVEASTTTTTEEASTTSSLPNLPVGQSYGIDDLNEDGVPDAMCGPQDFGGGLVLLRYCDAAGFASTPPDGVTLVDGSLFSWPTRNEDFPMDGISGDAVIGVDEQLQRVRVIVFNSDGLFATGSATVEATDTFDNLIARINESAPGSVLQVRGHTDSTGSPDANQALSEQRAEAVRAYLVDHGVQAAEVTAIGFGQNQPLAVEDGDAGRQFNRRVELVIRPPA